MKMSDMVLSLSVSSLSRVACQLHVLVCKRVKSCFLDVGH